MPKIKRIKPITAKISIGIPRDLLETVVIVGEEVCVLSRACCEMLTELSVAELVAVLMPKNKELIAINTQKMLNTKIIIDVILSNVLDFFI